VGSHECVFDCACIGLPDEKWGEKIVVVVALKGGVDEKNISEKDIQDCCRVKLASYKRPKDIIFIKSDEMPRTPTGKILHRKLKDRYVE
jgi:acyl-CoA synthetase (AMP-forming)/AMP-acid ligase II